MLSLDRDERRGVLLAPLVAPLGYFAGAYTHSVWQWMTNGTTMPDMGNVVRLLGLILAVGAPIAYAAMAVVGLPAYLLLRRASHVRRGPLWAAGVVVGAVIAAVLQPSLRGDLISIPFPTWSGALLGLLTAEVFWRLAGRRERADSADVP